VVQRVWLLRAAGNSVRIVTADRSISTMNLFKSYILYLLHKAYKTTFTLP
jgi:hypothetical protein